MAGADLILTDGALITMEPSMPRAEAVAVKDGIIVFVGSAREALSFRSGKTEVIDLKGKTLVPGFIETHVHPIMFGTTLLELNCSASAVDSISTLQKKVRQAAAKAPKCSWIRGFGWDDSKLAEKRNPDRHDLDQVAPDNPVLLRRTCGHVSAVNSRALDLSGITADTADPEGGHIVKDPDTGEPTGIIQEKAQMMLAVPEHRKEDYVEGMLVAQGKFAEWGITTVHDIGTDATGLAVYQEMLKDRTLKLRMRPWLRALNHVAWVGTLTEATRLGLQSGFGNDMLKFQGMKYSLDGSVGGRTAAVSEPYEGEEDNRGILYTTEEKFIPDVVAALQGGLRVGIHAIGERSIELAIRSIEAALPEVDVASMRNRIEHCGLPTDDQLTRMKELNILAMSSIGFLYGLGDSYYKNLGPERMKRVYPHKTFIERGIIAPGNSDCPVCSGNPLLGIYGAVTRKTGSGLTLDTEQNISVTDAVKAYTWDAAYASFEEDRLGSLAVGKLADMAVLSANPLEVPEDDLKDIKVDLTIMNGSIIFGA